MRDREIHLRGVTLGVCDHLPIDRDDALKYLDDTRTLIDRRKSGAYTAPTAETAKS
jgi:hypothetical protein